MRTLLTFSLWVAAMSELQADTLVYVSMAPEQKIGIHRLDEATGKLTPVAEIPVKGTPGALAFAADHRYLFASLRSNAALGSYRVDAKTGKFSPIDEVSLGKNANAAFVGLDQTGRWLLSASYMAGKVVCHGVKDGAIAADPVQVETTKVTAHAAVFSPDNGWLFVPHVTPNAVFQFRFDGKTGKFAAAGQAPGGKPKAGPRHLAFHPKLPLAFTSDESGSSITAYAYDQAKGLRPVETLSTLPKDFKGNNTTAEVKVHPSGKFVWVSNRGHDSLAGFAIDPKTGKLTALGQTPTEKTPRSFDIEPQGRYVFGAGEGSGKLVVYRVEANGTLTRLHTYPLGRSLTWVRSVRFGE